jgi:SAM-dependent methyltransferase
MKRAASISPFTDKNLDDPATTFERRRIIQSKAFLKKIYQEWYSLVIKALPEGDEPILELGAGAGFFQTVCPEAICSEIFYGPQVNLVVDGCALPFRTDSLRAIVLTNVLHHIPRPAAFFSESSRCVRSGGRLILIEPWVSQFSRFIYKHLHHEPFEPGAVMWEFASSGPLSGANGALAWMIFERDRQEFAARFPEWNIRTIRPFMSLRYLLSGGFAAPALMPTCTFDFWKKVEELVESFSGQTAMFAEIIIEKR